MDVKQVRYQKDLLEENLLEAIRKFEQVTGCKVVGIVLRGRALEVRDDFLVGLTVEVKI